MPITVANTTLSLSQIDQLREIVLQTNNILGTTIDPFTLENLNKSDWWQYEFARQVVSTTLVSEGYPALPEFSISDLNNGELPIVLIEYINASLVGGGSAQLLLVPTGAIETVDGEFQRFAYDGTNTFDFELQGSSYQIPIWYADLPLANRQSEYQISLKMPDLVEFGSASLYLVDADFDLDFFLSPSSLNHLLLQLRPEDGSTTLTVSAFGNSELSNSIGFTQPAAGSVISLTLNTTEISYAWDGGSGTLPIPDGFFSNPPNVVVFSSGDSASHIADLSVRFADLPSPLIE